MKRIAVIILITLSALGGGSSYAQETQGSQIVETETHSIFKGLFFKVWEKLKSINPTQKQSAKAAQIYTAGIRGAESTDTLLKPYWKDDLTQNKAFQAELQSFSKAQLKLDKGDLENAVKDFDRFLKQYQSSSLRPNALFAQSIGFAGIGNKEKSLASMQLFIGENPNHLLIDDAKQIVSELSS
jgi:TolA-binding protein